MPDRLALITGAAGGIGTELARRLATLGFHIVGVDLVADDVAAALSDLDALTPVSCDLSDPDQTTALADRIVGEWADDLQLLICNAGVVVPGDVTDTSPQKMDLQMSVMLSAPMQLMAAAARGMKERRRGHILATVSMGGILALPGSATYSAAKAGLRAYLAALGAELRGTGVSVSGIYPSAVDTPMLMHEATHDGSLLNFVGKISTTADVADGFERALRTRRLEVYVPYGDSMTTRLLQFFPWLLPKLLPALNRIGVRGRNRFLIERGRTPATLTHAE